RHVALSLARAARQLQVALEHLGHAVHAAVAQRTATGQCRDRADIACRHKWQTAVSTAALGETRGAMTEKITPEFIAENIDMV
ncbi:hypothetical protein BST36_30710, partial [Mycolicibacterium moriokaense]